MATAYLIVICNTATNVVEQVTIWSSPEWEQSRCLPQPTYVAYEVTADDFPDARKKLLQAIQEPKSRYHWLLAYLPLNLRGDASSQPETPCEATKATKLTSREWATQFVEKNKRFPHAIDYADAGYDQGSQCDCATVGECVLRDACNGHSCGRNCYTQQLKDYIVMSNTKRSATVQEDRPKTTGGLLVHISRLASDLAGRHRGIVPTMVHMPEWAEQLLLQGTHLPNVRCHMVWQAGDWRPRDICGMQVVWGSQKLDVV